MTYTTFYCNEKMLLDNWDYQNESNMMLRNILKKSNLSPSDCASIYYEKMNNARSVTYNRNHLIRKFEQNKRTNIPLLELDQVVLYQKDIDYIHQAQKNHHISYIQLRVLFGAIFFCRMYGSNIFSLDTEFKMRRFSKCFEEKTEIIYCAGGQWYDGYNTVQGMQIISDNYKLLERVNTYEIGCDYIYPEFDLIENDTVAYTFNVTLETNRLNLSAIIKQLFNMNEKYCVICGDKYISKKSNASLYCKKCAIEREKNRMASRRKKQPK